MTVFFEYLDEEAISDDLLDIQGQDSLLVDVPNRSRSPFIKTKALVISTWQQKPRAKRFILNWIIVLICRLSI